jgi:hypothetical protein
MVKEIEKEAPLGLMLLLNLAFDKRFYWIGCQQHCLGRTLEEVLKPLAGGGHLYTECPQPFLLPIMCLHAICCHIHEFCCNGLQGVTWRYILLLSCVNFLATNHILQFEFSRQLPKYTYILGSACKSRKDTRYLGM